MTSMPEPLIFPMGHYLGVNVPEAGAEPDFHVLRIGWDLYRLDGTSELPIWALAHGLPATGDEEPPAWTRSALAVAARTANTPNVAASIADLVERDLLIEVMPGTPEAVEFAKVCRTRSLLVGLGNTADEPDVFAIGAYENAPVVRVPAFTYELWKWGHACDSLWHACHVFAAAGNPADADERDPEAVLIRSLAAIQLLLATGAIYLDEAREDVLEPA